MRLRTPATPSSELIDSVMDGYVSWREESAAVDLAYERWGRAGAGERMAAFDKYVAALDREEMAAELFRVLIERASDGQSAPGAD